MSREHLALAFPFTVHPDPEGGYTVVCPDLPGCMPQVERPEEIGPAAEEIRALWLETEHEAGRDLPLPSYSEESAVVARTAPCPDGGNRAQG